MITERELREHFGRVKALNAESVVDAVPQLKRGQVWCYECGYTTTVHSPTALRLGWPKHCGYTMGIDSPDERAALKAKAEREDTP